MVGFGGSHLRLRDESNVGGGERSDVGQATSDGGDWGGQTFSTKNRPSNPEIISSKVSVNRILRD